MGKIRKEIKYNEREWERVKALSEKSGMLPAAYIRDKALNCKIMNILNSDEDDKWLDVRHAIYWGMNDIAHSVNTNKKVTAEQVQEMENFIDQLEGFADKELKPYIFVEVM